MNLPGYSPDCNADEAIWGWAREEATGNLCLGSRAAVQERVGKFLAGLSRPERRGETALPDGPAIKGRNTPARLPPRFPAPGKCTSHLGFGLAFEQTTDPPPQPAARRSGAGVRGRHSTHAGSPPHGTVRRRSLQRSHHPAHTTSPPVIR